MLSSNIGNYLIKRQSERYVIIKLNLSLTLILINNYSIYTIYSYTHIQSITGN